MGGSAVVEAEETQADFLFLRQLGQGASSVRVTDPFSIDNSESSVNLIAVSNIQGLLFAATNEGFIAHQLTEVRNLCSSSTRKNLPKLDKPLSLVKTVDDTQLGSKVSFLRLGDQDQRLIVGLANGRIAVWLVSDLIHQNERNMILLQPPSPNLTLLELSPNPSDRPELCIALYSASERNQLRSGIAICFNVKSGQWGAELKPQGGSQTTSLCWSVKGKQIVLGLQDGSLAQMTPEGESKNVVPRAQGLEQSSTYVEQVIWLENDVFLVTYNQAPTSEEPEHQYEVYTILRDPKEKTFQFIHFSDPAPPFGDTSRRGHRYTSWLKSWEPTKHMLFLANTSSTDVGLLGCMSNGTGPSSWRNLDLEDTSRPVLPFSSIDKSSDTCPVGLELDCTAEGNVDDPQAVNRGEEGKATLAPMPILYIYTNDGLLLAYTIINVSSSSAKYPGMIKSNLPSSSNVAPLAETTKSIDASNSKAATIATTAQPSSVASAATTFGQSNGFGGFASGTPAFGQSAPIGSKSPSPFSFNPSTSTSQPATFSTSSQNGGFGAFASKPNNAFGGASTSFSFGGDDVSKTSVSPAFGSTTFSTPAFGATASPTSAFGATSSPANVFGASGAPANNNDSTFASSTTPSFGSSSTFGAAATGFGQPSTFGALATATKSPFATNTPSNAFSSSTSNISSGFGGFASKGTTSFGVPLTSATESSNSIFGNGGNLSSSSTTGTTLFGQSLTNNNFENSSTSTFGGVAKETTNFDMDEGEAGSDAGALSFGGMGGLLGDADDSKKPDSKPTGFTFGSKQDATFSSMPSPTPFSFANTTDKAKVQEMKPPSSTFGNTVPKSRIADDNTQAEEGKQESLGETSSTTPFSSPVKEQTTSTKSPFASTTPTATPLKQEVDIKGQDADDKSEDRVSGDKTEGAEEDWDDEDESDEEGDETVESNGGLEEKEEQERSYDDKEGEEEGDYREEEDEGEEVEEIDDGEEEEAQDNEEDSVDEHTERKAVSVKESRPKEVKEEAQKDVVEKQEEAKKDTKADLDSSTSFSFLPATKETPLSFSFNSNQAEISFKSAPFGAPQTASSSFSFSEASNSTPTIAKNQPFLNFSNRAPRSSSPLSGVPLNRTDFPPSPDKSLPKQGDNFKPITANSPAPLPPPAPIPNNVPQRTSLAKEVTPKLSFTEAKVTSKDIEGDGMQGVFLQTFLTMEKELKVLMDNVKKCSEFQVLLRVPNHVELSPDDLSDETMWTFGELDTKSKLTAGLASMTEVLSKETRTLKMKVKEIQSQQLKVDVKREEIARFIRARNDPSFSRLVRVKQLGPEYAENQSKLRRATMTIREGIEDLEAYLEKVRKVILDQKMGTPFALKAPSLDIIRRTARNITQSAQIRLMELQEIELSYDRLTQDKPIILRNTNGISSMGQQQSSVFDSLSKMEDALPSVGSFATGHKGPDGNINKAYATNAHLTQKQHLDLRSVFKSGWKKPILTRLSKEVENAEDEYKLSDLNMVFAKGTIRVMDSKPVAAAAPTMINDGQVDFPTTSGNSASQLFTTPSTAFKLSKGAATPSFSFNPLPSTTLPQDAFQLPPEDAPFSPGGHVLASNVGRAHTTKFGGKRNAAVALPSMDPTSASLNRSDFFASPASKQSQTTPSSLSFDRSGIKPGGFVGFGGAQNFANETNSISSRLGSMASNVTFKGLQPMQPMVQSKSSSLAAIEGGGGEDDSDTSSEERSPYEKEGEREEEFEEESEEEERGLSDVVEGEEDYYG